MSAIAFSADGEYLFVALEDASTGNQIVVKAARDDLSSWSVAYNPGGGSDCNIQPCVADPNIMFFHGEFGSDVYLIKHTISDGVNTDISPSDLTGAEYIDALQSNPDNANEIAITISNAADIRYTDDGGTTWTTWDAATGITATALWLLWSGQHYPNRYFAGGIGADLDYLYSPNEGASDEDRASAGLAALENITNIEAT